MFDESLPEPAGLAALDDATVIDAITGWARTEAAAAARRLAAIAELVRRRAIAEEADERAHWLCDFWESACAEVAAAQNITTGLANGQMHLAQSLQYRLPKVAALFAAGQINLRLVTTIAARTDLIVNEDIALKVDTSLAEDITRWGVKSQKKTEEAIDYWVNRHDPAALRQPAPPVDNRSVEIGDRSDPAGIATVWGKLYASDGVALDRRLTQMARGVCDQDPRTVDQRRADALGALAAGALHLPCACANPECPTLGDDTARSQPPAVIHIVADTPAITAATTPDSTAPTGTAVITGGGIVPAPLLTELIRRGATLRPIHHPGDAPPEPGYRPSTALAEFVRMRDMTCRFPNCDCPAEYCDIDHTMPWPLGPTHASNLKCLCRKNHLLKTFWTGDTGWKDEQHPDGTITWTAPSGQTYTTKPGSRLLFPTLCTPTATLILPTTRPNRTPGQSLTMPTRRQTRKQQRDARIRRERALNDAHVAEQTKPPPF